MVSQPGRIPVTVIAGFLGAGKTTLVNHLLRTRAEQIGVIVNEFGSVGVDGGLIEAVLDSPAGVQDVQELTAGCLCCSGREDLLRALVTLAQRPAGSKLQHLLIELSGVADPVPVLHTLLEPDVKRVFRLAGLVTVADARHLPQTVRDHPEAALQLAYASHVVLNKTDLVTTEQLRLSRQLVRGLQPLARLTEAQKGVGPSTDLLSGDFGSDWQLPAIQTQHTAGLKSFVLQADRSFDLAAWSAFLNSVAARPGAVLRVKGYASLDAFPQKLLLQAVRDVINVELAGAEEMADGRTQLVMIGRDLVPAQEQAAFTALVHHFTPG